MRKTLLIAFLVATTPLVGLGEGGPRPKPARGGDYWLRSEHTWVGWEATSELAGRLTPQWPADFQEPEALLHIDWRIDRWPVVHKFAKGDRLRALPDATGNIIMKDVDGSSWLRLQLDDGQICFVRANAKFVKPVDGPMAPAPPPPPNQPPATEEPTATVTAPPQRDGGP